MRSAIALRPVRRLGFLSPRRPRAVKKLLPGRFGRRAVRRQRSRWIARPAPAIARPADLAHERQEPELGIAGHVTRDHHVVARPQRFRRDAGALELYEVEPLYAIALRVLGLEIDDDMRVHPLDVLDVAF